VQVGQGKFTPVRQLFYDSYRSAATDWNFAMHFSDFQIWLGYKAARGIVSEFL
jgi:hypothetical protein